MKRDRRILFLVLSLLLLAGGLAQAADPFPPVEIPGIPDTGEYCLFRFSKFFDGILMSEPQSAWGCTAGETRRSKTEINFRVYSNGGRECDEEVPGVPANLFLHARGFTLHRGDKGPAHFTGTVELKDGAAGPTIFEGTMELTARMGTHEALGEACNEFDHVEGWIVARGVGRLNVYTLRAMIAAKADLPDGLANEAPSNRITGVIIKAP
jgi:hypothetical protein